MGQQSVLLQLIPGLIGALIGAAVAWYLARQKETREAQRHQEQLSFEQRQQQEQLSFRFIDWFFGNYDRVAEVKQILAETKNGRFPHDTEEDRTEENKVRLLGDWFNHVANLVVNKRVDVPLLRNVGLIWEARELRHRIINAGLHEFVKGLQDLSRLEDTEVKGE